MFIRSTLSSDFESFVPSHFDILEAQAMGITPSFPDASECVTLSHNDTPIAIGGHCGDRCWFVTSEEVEKLSLRDKIQFRKMVIEYRDGLLEKYDHLWNFVWIGNHPHIKFLKSIGAVFHEEYTRDGQFQLFTIRR